MKKCISLLFILIILTSCTQQSTSETPSVSEHQGVNMIEGSSQGTLRDDAVREVVQEPETSKPERKTWPGKTRDVDGVLMSNAAYSTQPTTVYTGDQYMDMEVAYAGKSLHNFDNEDVWELFNYEVHLTGEIELRGTLAYSDAWKYSPAIPIYFYVNDIEELSKIPTVAEWYTIENDTQSVQEAIDSGNCVAALQIEDDIYDYLVALYGEPDGSEEQIDEILIENCIVVVDDIYYFFQEGTGYMVQRATVKSINGINLR